MRKGIIAVCLSLIIVIGGVTWAIGQVPWPDANKRPWPQPGRAGIPGPLGDDKMCWVAAAANIFASTGWYTGDAQTLYNNSIGPCTNGGGWLKDAWWPWIDGKDVTPDCEGQGWCPGWEKSSDSFVGHYRYYFGPEVMEAIRCSLDNKYGVGIRISKKMDWPDGPPPQPGPPFDERYVIGHALSVWEYKPHGTDIILTVTDSDDEKLQSYDLVVNSSGQIVDAPQCSGGECDYENWQIEVVETLSPPGVVATHCDPLMSALNGDVKFTFVRKICLNRELWELHGIEEDIACRVGETGTITFKSSLGEWICDSNCLGFIVPIPVGKVLEIEHITETKVADPLKFLWWEILEQRDKVETRDESKFTLTKTEDFCLLLHGSCSSN